MAVKNKVTEVSVKKKAQKVVIEDYYDGFAVVVDEERFHFDQEESVVDLVAVFRAVGCVNVGYEEVY